MLSNRIAPLLLALATSITASSQQVAGGQSPISLIIVNKDVEKNLELLRQRVPNLLARKNLKVGQWMEYELRLNVASTPGVVAAIDETETVRTEIVRLTADQVTLNETLSNGDRHEKAWPREHFLSRESIGRSLKNVQGAQDSEIRGVKLVRLEERQPELIEVAARKLRCGKISFEAEIEGEDSEGPVRIKRRSTWWYSERIPIDGIAKMVDEITVKFAGAQVDSVVTQRVLAYGEARQ